MKRPRPPSCTDDNKSIHLPLKLMRASDAKEKRKFIDEFIVWSHEVFLPIRATRVTELIMEVKATKSREALKTCKHYIPILYKELEHAREHAFALRTIFTMCVGPRQGNSPFYDEAMFEISTTLSEGWIALDTPLQVLSDPLDRMVKNKKIGDHKESAELRDYMISVETQEHLRETLLDFFQRLLMHHCCLCYRLMVDHGLILEACNRTKTAKEGHVL